MKSLLPALALVAMFYIGLSSDARAGDSKAARVRSDLQALTIAVDGFYQACGVYPTTAQGLNALVKEPKDFTGKRWIPFMAAPPMDPWNQPYAYRQPGIHNPKSYDIYSLGPDGKVSADDLGNWKVKGP